MNRTITYHKTALAAGTKAELEIVTAMYADNPRLLLTDGVDAMIPVAITLSSLESTLKNDPTMKDMRGYMSLVELLRQLHGEDVSWLVLDTKRGKVVAA